MEHQQAGDCQVELSIRNPSKNQTNFCMAVSVHATVAEVKQLLSEKYPARPAARLQTLIYAGKVLKNETKLSEILPQPWASSTPHNLHLVVKQSDAPASAPPSTSSTSRVQQSTGNGHRNEQPRPQADASRATPLPATGQAAGNSSAQNSAQPQGGASTSDASPPVYPQYCPVYMVNPVMAAAYQAAYAAALATTVRMHQLHGGQMQSSPNASPVPAQMSPMMFMSPYNLPQPHVGTAGSAGNADGQQRQMQFAAYPQMAPAPFPVGFMPFGMPPMPYQAMQQLQMQQQGFAAQMRQAEQVRQNARFAFPEGARYRRRVLSFRISLRTLLQFIVFAVVFYKQVSFTRLIILVLGGLTLFLTANFAPLRRLISGMGQAAAADNNTQRPQRRGILWEIAIVVVGFITSLIPAWNYNPADAAAFQAAQDMFAQEDENENNGQRGQPAGNGQEAQPQNVN